MAPFTHRILASHVVFTVGNTFLCPPPVFAHLILVTRHLGVSAPHSRLISMLLRSRHFVVTNSGLSIKRTNRVISFVISTHPRTIKYLLSRVPGVGCALLGRAVSVLDGHRRFLGPLRRHAHRLLFSASTPTALII